MAIKIIYFFNHWNWVVIIVLTSASNCLNEKRFRIKQHFYFINVNLLPIRLFTGATKWLNLKGKVDLTDKLDTWPTQVFCYRNLILSIFDQEARWINFLITSDSWRVSGPVGFAKLGVVLILLCKESVSIADLVNKLTGTLLPHFTSAFCWTSPSPLRFKVAFGMPTFFLVWFLSFTCTRSYHAKFSEIRFIR